MATLFTAWQGVLQRISAAQNSTSRHTDSPVQLIAVSKTFPVEDIRTLYALGQRDFGENYAQEFADKQALLVDCPDLIWHFIGPLQSNKTRLVAERAHWCHTIDRLKIAERLNSQRPDHLPALNACIQVNVSGEPSKSGVSPQEVSELAHAFGKLEKIRLRGLMAIPEAAADETHLAAQFALLRQLRDDLSQEGLALDVLSMGMSADLELAIREGATHIRVGTAIFGGRDYSKKVAA